MFLIAPVDNNRWVYAMHGLEKPMDHMAGNDLSDVLRSIDRKYASSVEDRDVLKLEKYILKKYIIYSQRKF